MAKLFKKILTLIILEKANELYDLLTKAKEEVEIGNSNQRWLMIETQTALGSLIEEIGG